MSDFEPVIINASAVQSRPVSWLWPGFIPRGKLTILCGDPGLGKSFVTLDIACRASRGGRWPFEACPPDAPDRDPLRVALLSAEDDPADTIRPRLEAMGADLANVDIIDSMVGRDRRVTDFVIGEHAADLEKMLSTGNEYGLLVVDPVSAYVGQADSYNNAQVRAMLKPLADLAADHNVAIVLITHLRKSEAAKALHAAMGSLAFTAAARVVLLVARDKTDHDLRLLLTVKSNLSSDRLGFSYKIVDGKVEWVDVVEGQADELLAPAKAVDSAESVGFINALRARLAAGVTATAQEVRDLASAHGLSWTIVERASFKRAAGFSSRRVKDGWVWCLAK